MCFRAQILSPLKDAKLKETLGAGVEEVAQFWCHPFPWEIKVVICGTVSIICG